MHNSYQKGETMFHDMAFAESSKIHDINESLAKSSSEKTLTPDQMTEAQSAIDYYWGRMNLYGQIEHDMKIQKLGIEDRIRTKEESK